MQSKSVTLTWSQKWILDLILRVGRSIELGPSFSDLSFFLKILFIYFWREGKGGRKRGRDTSMCGCLSCAPYWRPGPQPRHVP